MRHKIGMDYSDIISQRKNKRDLPFILKLKKKLDIVRLQEELTYLLGVSKNDNNFKYDKASSEHNYNLSNTKGVNFVHNYNEIYKTYAKIGFQSLSDDALELAKTIEKPVESFTPYERAKGMKHTNSVNYHPYYDERNYTKRTEFCTPYINEILDGFGGDEACRAAIVTLEPGKFLSPHFDIGPEFVVRLQIPIITNTEAVMGFRKDSNTWYEYHMPADGTMYFVNSGWEHYAVNNGTENRYQLRICLNGQENLDGAEEFLPTRIFSHETFCKRPESGNYFGNNDNNIMSSALTELGMDSENYKKYASAKV
jgi:hypothetical protein